MSQSSSSPSADEADSDHGKNCNCDDCYFTPPAEGYSYVLMDCVNKSYGCIFADDFFFKCVVCKLDHVICDKVITTKKGQPVYTTVPFEPESASRWFKNLKRLSDENRELRGLRTKAEELQTEKEELEKMAEEQKAELRRAKKYGMERQQLLELERTKKENYKTQINEFHKEKAALKKELAEAKQALEKCEAQKAEEFASLEESVARLEKESNEKTALARQAADGHEVSINIYHEQLTASQQQLEDMTEERDEAKEALEELQKEAEGLRETGEWRRGFE